MGLGLLCAAVVSAHRRRTPGEQECPCAHRPFPMANGRRYSSPGEWEHCHQMEATVCAGRMNGREQARAPHCEHGLWGRR